MTFAVAALIGGFGLGRLGSVLSLLSATTRGIKAATLLLVTLLLLFLLAAVVFALFALRTRKCKGVSRSDEYVEELYDKDRDTINRSISFIYQSAADENWETNERLAGQVNRSMFFTTVSFVAAMLLIGTYAYATWCDKCGLGKLNKGVTVVASKKDSESGSNAPKKEKPAEPVKVRLRDVTQDSPAGPDTIKENGEKNKRGEDR